MDFEQLEELIRELETAPDNRERQRLYQLIAPVVELHRVALQRIADTIRDDHPETMERLLEDEIVGPLLRGYDIAGVDLAQRVAAALEHARPLLRSHGGDVRLIEMRGKVAVLEMTGSCHGCASSLITLKRGIEQALYDEVPELRGVEVAGVTAPAAAPGSKWVPLVSWSDLRDGEWMKVQVLDDELLVCTIDERPFAFRNRCPEGGESLEASGFHHLIISCPAHDYHFDLRSGACSERSQLRLDVLPVMVEDAVVKVAL